MSQAEMVYGNIRGYQKVDSEGFLVDGNGKKIDYTHFLEGNWVGFYHYELGVFEASVMVCFEDSSQLIIKNPYQEKLPLCGEIEEVERCRE